MNPQALTASIVLPTYNEKENIQELIRQLLKSNPNDVELIVVDDNSPDMTWQIAEDMGLPQVRVIRRFENKGVGPSIWEGIQQSRGKYVVWMDCDLTMPPSLVPQMIKLLGEYDVVVGSRYEAGGKDDRAFVRVITSRIINLFANLVLNFKILDYDSGFIAAQKRNI